MRSLIDKESALETYGGLSYLVSMFSELDELSPMQLEFTYEGCTIYVHYYSSLINGRIRSNIHISFMTQSLYILSIFLVHACENYPISRSTPCASSLHQGSISTWF